MSTRLILVDEDFFKTLFPNELELVFTDDRVKVYRNTTTKRKYVDE